MVSLIPFAGISAHTCNLSKRVLEDCRIFRKVDFPAEMLPSTLRVTLGESHAVPGAWDILASILYRLYANLSRYWTIDC